MPRRAPRWVWGNLGAMRIKVHLLKELNISGNAAAAFTTVGGSCLAAGVTIARCLRWGRWPRERPENRGAAGEGVSLLLVGIGVVLVLYAIMQERLPEVEGLIVTLQQALKR